MSPRKTYILKLYVAGNTPNSMRALKTLRNILDTEFQGVYALKVMLSNTESALASSQTSLEFPQAHPFHAGPIRHKPCLVLGAEAADRD
jgi:circadian clock protein KaiB